MNIINVTVVYALPHVQYIYPVDIEFNATVKDVLIKSKILNIVKCFSLYQFKVGINNKIVNLQYKIKNGDRIEIYRYLSVDPRERRRKKII